MLSQTPQTLLPYKLSVIVTPRIGLSGWETATDEYRRLQVWLKSMRARMSESSAAAARFSCVSLCLLRSLRDPTFASEGYEVLRPVQLCVCVITPQRTRAPAASSLWKGFAVWHFPAQYAVAEPPHFDALFSSHVHFQPEAEKPHMVCVSILQRVKTKTDLCFRTLLFVTNVT